AEQRGGTRRGPEDFERRFVAARGLRGAGDDEALIELDAGSLEGLSIPGEATPCCWHVVDVRHESDPTVAVVHQLLHGLPRPADFVRDRSEEHTSELQSRF